MNKVILLTPVICVLFVTSFFCQSKSQEEKSGFQFSEILPVELVYFFAVDVDSGSILFFGTATEVENYGFDIQRAYSDLTFESIGFVEGNGNSNSPKNYNYFDSTIIKSGTVYYRLKQIDFKGTFDFSDTVSIDYLTNVKEENIKPSANFYISDNFPNPFNPSTKINFQIPSQQLIIINLYDVNGKLVKELSAKEYLSGSYSLSIDFSEFSSGIYFVRFLSDNLLETRKLNYIK